MPTIVHRAEPEPVRSILGSRFEGSYQWGESGRVIPKICGRAYVYSEAHLLQNVDDPFRNGIV